MKNGDLHRLAGLLMAIYSSGAAASFTITHLGSENPTTEGFVAVACCGPSAAGPASNDLGNAAWSIAGQATSSQYAYYSGPLTLSQITEVANQGFAISFEARALSGLAPAYTASAPYVVGGGGLDTGGRRFFVTLGLDANGDTVAVLPTSIGVGSGGSILNSGSSYTLPGSGSTYHSYELAYSPTTQLATLYIDGTQRIQGYAGTTDFAGLYQGLNFGAWSGGQVNFAYVQLASPVPEPSKWAMMGIGLLLLSVSGRSVARSGLRPA